MASLYSMALVVSAWVWRIRSEREGDGDEGEEAPSKHLIVLVTNMFGDALYIGCSPI